MTASFIPDREMEVRDTLVLSLFPGIDFLGRAFETEGFCVVSGPDVVWGRDVRTFHPPAARFDGLIGGPPCQEFSPLANLVRAKGYQPKFGNLIPEFERCVREAAPAWFLMENVGPAPMPVVEGYGIHSFFLDNAAMAGADGLGQEQERLRRFSYGVRGGGAVDLRCWIQLAALFLPGRSKACTQSMVDNSDEAKGRVRSGTVTWQDGPGVRVPEGRYRRRAVLGSDAHDVPVAIGGSGKPKPGCRMPAVTSSGGRTYRRPPVTAAHAGAKRPKGGYIIRYRLPEALRLQGFPKDMLEHAPFTAKAKLKLVANGIPRWLGVALARAIRQHWGLPLIGEVAS